MSTPSTTRSTPAAGIPLFRLFGVQVSLHWLWLVVAVYEINTRRGHYEHIGWNAAEYLTLFGIVLLHEFGHALACKSVGGKAERILLWPLGGVAYVQPPQRPGAVLWSIAAGPLVNVLLIPVTLGAVWLADARGIGGDAREYLSTVALINFILLIFNMLPIYPLDGGQIVRALLWFFIGPARSLLIASVLGLAGAVAGTGWLLMTSPTMEGRIWTAILGLYAISRSWAAFKFARALGRFLSLPRQEGLRCPSCRQSPPLGAIWGCPCGERIDLFATGPTCPRCGAAVSPVPCPFCGIGSDWTLWVVRDGAQPPSFPSPERIMNRTRDATA